MGYAGWPTAADVTAALGSYGAAVPSGFDADGEVLAVVASFERSAGVSPVLADGSSTAVEVVLDGFVGPVVSLPVAFTAVASVVLDETELVADQDWFLEGLGAVRRLRLASAGWTGRLSVTGTVGLFDEVPDDVWTAVRDLVVVKAIEAGLGVNGGLSEVRQDSVTLKYVSGGVSGLREQSLAILAKWESYGLGGV